jgi:hypothetical protein
MITALGKSPRLNYSNNNNFRKSPNLNFGSSIIPKEILVDTVSYFGQMGQIKSTAIRSAGKALLSPLVILFNPLVKKNEDKQSRRYSAALMPIEAAVSFFEALAVNFLICLSLSSLAKKGKLGQFYNPVKNIIGQANLNILQDRVSIIMTLITIPFVSSLTNKLFPKLVNKTFPDFLSDSKRKEVGKCL